MLNDAPSWRLEDRPGIFGVVVKAQRVTGDVAESKHLDGGVCSWAAAAQLYKGSLGEPWLHPPRVELLAAWLW